MIARLALHLHVTRKLEHSGDHSAIFQGPVQPYWYGAMQLRGELF